MKKKVLTTLVSGIVMMAVAIIIGYLFSFLFPAMQKEYENPAIYRPWNDPLMYLFFIQPFVVAAAMVWGWDRIKEKFQGSIGRKALNVTLILLFLSIIPGMIMTISTFVISVPVVITWTVSAFIQIWAGSLVFIRMAR